MSNDLNSIQIIGRLTRDLGTQKNDFGYLKNQTAFGRFDIATKRTKKEGNEYKDEVSFFEVIAYGKIIENLKPYLLKGKQICVNGELKQDRWQKNGQFFSKVYILANEIHLLEKKDNLKKL